MVIPLTFHALHRMKEWALHQDEVFQTLLYPQEVLRGHGDRYIAHKVDASHVIRVVYEYDKKIVVVVTVYKPYKDRYFQGGVSFADQILSRR